HLAATPAATQSRPPAWRRRQARPTAGNREVFVPGWTRAGESRHALIMSNNPSGAATLITVAPTGAESEKSAVPALPVTLDELVTTAKECQAAGAAAVHVHIRDAEAR